MSGFKLRMHKGDEGMIEVWDRDGLNLAGIIHRDFFSEEEFFCDLTLEEDDIDVFLTRTQH